MKDLPLITITIRRPYPRFLTNVDGTLFFSSLDSAGDRELWKSDGTEGGTRLVKDIRIGEEGSFRFFNSDNMTVVEETLYFTADDGIHGRELWRSDGSEKGTILVADINTGEMGSAPNNLTYIDGRLFFTADDGVHGEEPWVLSLVAGDTDGDGDVDPNDINNILRAGKFGDLNPTEDALWSEGDFNRDGVVDAHDITQILLETSNIFPFVVPTVSDTIANNQRATDAVLAAEPNSTNFQAALETSLSRRRR